MAETAINLDKAVALTRTGDLWLFRGKTTADRAIRLTTNSPVNHVGMALVLDDMPPLMWHAELGRSLPDMFSGTRHRGAQLHDLRDAVLVWAARYGQRAWLRQLERPATRDMEDAALRTVARLDGTPFPSTTRLATRWLRGRTPSREQLRRRLPWVKESDERETGTEQTVIELETAYCAEIVGLTYEAMGLLATGRRPSWYDPGRFWSGDALPLTDGARLGEEIAVSIPDELLAGARRQ